MSLENLALLKGKTYSSMLSSKRRVNRKLSSFIFFKSNFSSFLGNHTYSWIKSKNSTLSKLLHLVEELWGKRFTATNSQKKPKIEVMPVSFHFLRKIYLPQWKRIWCLLSLSHPSIMKQRVWALEFFEVFWTKAGSEKKICEHHGTARANVSMSMLDVFLDSY